MNIKLLVVGWSVKASSLQDDERRQELCSVGKALDEPGGVNGFDVVADIDVTVTVRS